MYFDCGFGATLAGDNTHGQTQRSLARRVMDQARTAPPANTAYPTRRSSLGEPSSRRRRPPVGAETRRSVAARPASGVSESVDLLAPLKALGPGRLPPQYLSALLGRRTDPRLGQGLPMAAGPIRAVDPHVSLGLLTRRGAHQAAELIEPVLEM